MQFIPSSQSISYHYAPEIIQFYEYTLDGELTPQYEEKIKLIIKQAITRSIPLTLIKYWDEKMDTSLENDKKKRTIVIVSDICFSAEYLKYNYFKDCELNVVCYYKQRVI